MSRIVCVLLLTVCSAQVRGSDLPPGAIARLGDPSFRTGGRVEHLALSPDGKQYATSCDVGQEEFAVAVWDSATGRRVREQKLNAPLFRGLVWGAGGSLAVAIRTELDTTGRAPKVTWDDFCVWDFTDPKAEPPLVPSYFDGAPARLWEPPQSGPRYETFVFSADGRRLAAGWRSTGGKHTIRVFELKPASTAAQLKQLCSLDLGAEGADGFELSADGAVLVTFRALAARGPVEEWTATAWDVTTGRPTQPVRVSNRRMPQLTPDGRAALGADELVHFDGARDPRPQAPPTNPKPPAEGENTTDERDRKDAVFFPSGEALVVPGRWTIVYDLKTNKERGRFGGHAAAPNAVAVSADGTRVATADQFGLVRLWDAKSMRPLNDVRGHRATIREMELSPDGKRLLTLADDETVRLWDVATGQELRSFAPALASRKSFRRGERFTFRPRFAPDGTAVVYNAPDRLLVRDLQTGFEVPIAGGLKDVQPAWIAFAPDGKSVLTGQRGGPLEVWAWPSGQKRFAVDLSDFSGRVSEPGFTPAGAIFANAMHPERWSGTGHPLPAAWQGVELTARAVGLRDELRLPVACSESTGALQAFDAGTAKPISDMRPTTRDFVDFKIALMSGLPVALAPNGRQFALCTAHFGKGQALVCESATSKVRWALPAAPGAKVLGFTPDGSKLLTAVRDHTILVWDMRLRAVPLPEALKKETNAVKLWDALAEADAKAAYLAMARLSREPSAAVKMAKLRLKPATKGAPESETSKVTDARAVELLEALATDEARALLKELAGGHATAFRTQEAKRALERHE